MRSVRIRTLMIVVAAVGLVMGCAVGVIALRRASAHYQTRAAIHEREKQTVLLLVAAMERDLAAHPELASLRGLVLYRRQVDYHDSLARRYLRASGRPWQNILDDSSLPSLDALPPGFAEEVIALAASRKLPWLDLARCGVTDTSLASVRTCTSLQSLNLSRNQITGPGLAHLEDLRELDLLNLANNPITDAGLVNLETLTKLRTLDLSHTGVTTAGISRLARALPETRITHDLEM